MIGINGKVHLKTARTEAGCLRGKNLTMSEVAEKTGFSLNTIMEWEKVPCRKKPRVDQLDAYCRVCGCRPEDIIFD